MKKWLDRLPSSIRIALLIYALGVLAFLILMPFFFYQMMDIPLGALLGGILTGTIYLLSYFSEKWDSQKGNATFTIIMQAVRFVAVIVVMVLISFMYFRWDMKIFNPFSFIAIYTGSVVINVIVMLKERNQ